MLCLFKENDHKYSISQCEFSFVILIRKLCEFEVLYIFNESQFPVIVNIKRIRKAPKLLLFKLTLSLINLYIIILFSNAYIIFLFILFIARIIKKNVFKFISMKI